MSKASLKNQLIHAVCSCESYGESRHREKQNADNAWKVFSIGEKDQLQKRCADFAGFLKENFSDVRRVVDIEPGHVQAWLDAKADTCSQTTLSCYVSNFRKIDTICQHVYGAKMRADRVVPPQSRKENPATKTQTMDSARIEKLIAELKSTGSQAWKAVALADAVGLRVQECAKIHVECFSLTGGKYNCGAVHLRAGSIDGAKHGRERTVDILTPQARDAVRECLQGTQPGQTVIQKAGGSPLKAESIDRAISRAMDRINHKEGGDVFGAEWKENKVHAIRKNFAQNCWDTSRKETQSTMSEKQSKKEACAFVNGQLGHGDARMDSISTYVGIPW